MPAIVPLLRWPAPAAALWLACAAGGQAEAAKPGPSGEPEASKAASSKAAANAPSPPAPAEKARVGKRPGKRPGKPKVLGTLNLNRATEAELRLLPGIGKGRAHAIVERRPKAGYRSVDDVGRIKGLRRLVQKLKGHLTTEGPTTLRPAPPETGRGPAS